MLPTGSTLIAQSTTISFNGENYSVAFWQMAIPLVGAIDYISVCTADAQGNLTPLDAGGVFNCLSSSPSNPWLTTVQTIHGGGGIVRFYQVLLDDLNAAFARIFAGLIPVVVQPSTPGEPTTNDEARNDAINWVKQGFTLARLPDGTGIVAAGK